jgi:hypothetical protein
MVVASRPLIARACFCVALALAAARVQLPTVDAQESPSPAAVRASAPSPAEMEAFLLRAPMSRVRDAGGGVTGSQRATLSDGTLTHDVHIQTVDVAKTVFTAGNKSELNFKDTYRYNIAGYRLARLLGINTVPMSVERSVNGKTAAVTWWVDDVMMDEKARTAKKTSGPNPGRTASQLFVMRVWDELIQNKDRNQGNILWTSDWTLWLIDHTRAFRLGKELLKPKEMLRCERGLFERLKSLTDESIAAAVGSYLTKEEREAVLARRDLIVKQLADRIAKAGEDVVLFTIDQS